MLLDNESENFFRTIEFFNKVCGVWLEKDGRNVKKIAHILWDAFLFLLALFFFLCEVAMMRHTIGELKQLIRHVGMLATHAAGFLKFAVLILNQRRIAKLKATLQDNQYYYEKCSNFSPGRIVSESKRFCHRYTIVTYLLYSMVGVSAHISALWHLNAVQKGEYFTANVTCYDFMPYFFVIPFSAETTTGCKNAFIVMDLGLGLMAWYIACRFEIFPFFLIIVVILYILGYAVVYTFKSYFVGHVFFYPTLNPCGFYIIIEIGKIWAWVYNEIAVFIAAIVYIYLHPSSYFRLTYRIPPDPPLVGSKLRILSLDTSPDKQCQCVSAINSYDALLCSLLICLKTKLHILCEATKAIRERVVMKLDFPEKYRIFKDDLNPQFEAEMYAEIRRINFHLESLLSVCIDVEAIFSYTTLIQTLTSSVVLASCLFVASLVPYTDPEFYSRIEYSLAIICQLLMICYFGNLITEVSMSYRYSLYECDWYSSSKRFKQAILIMMCRIEKPLYLTIGKFSPLNLNTFLSVVKGSFSYAAVFRTVD